MTLSLNAFFGFIFAFVTSFSSDLIVGAALRECLKTLEMG